MLGLVLDEPKETDQIEQIDGMKFLLDGELAQGLKQFLPVQVDFDDRYFGGLRVRASRRSACC